MSKVYIREKSGGGLLITSFSSSFPDFGNWIEKDPSDITGDPDTARIDSGGNVYHDPTIVNSQTISDQNVATARTQLKLLRLSDTTIDLILRR